MKQSDKKVSFDDPQNGGHFSCRKPVSHVGTSTVSDSEALIHLAYVQHMWQSKFVVILEGLTRWNWIVFKDAISWEMTTDAFWYACLLAGKSFAMQLWQQKLENLHHFWTPKWRLKNGPKNGARIWPPKWGPKMAPKRGAQYSFGRKKIYKKSKLYLKYWVSLLGAIFGPHFRGSNSGTIFWDLHFSTSILGSKNGAKFAKVFAVKAA